MSQLLTHLQSRQVDMVKLLESWVNQDSPTYNKQAVDEMGMLTVRGFERAGATLAAVHQQPELGDHYTVTFGSGDEQILILCHFDTVWPMGETVKRPFTLKNGMGLGPGVHDMKGGTLIGLFAIGALAHFNLEPRYQVCFLLTSDEEIGSPSSRALIETEGRRSRYCLVLEGAHNRQLFTTARKGVARYRLKIIGRAAHSGVEPQNGVSAIEELAQQVLALHALNDPDRGTTVNVGVVSGGDRPNIIAGRAEAEIDVRVTSIEEGERITRQIESLLPHNPAGRLEISGGMTRPPFEETPAGTDLFTKAQNIATELGFAVEKYKSGGGSDGNLVAALGVPTLDGLGSLGGGAHALTEHTVIEALPQRAALLAELLTQL
jgi:glutamate carboxypeptidase